MTFETAQHLTVYLWLAVVVVWLIGAFAAKPTARAQSIGSRAGQIALGILACVVGFSRRFAHGLLRRPFVPAWPALAWCALALAAAGIGFAIWARLRLGGNWSGRITVKEGHTLVQRGPYSIVRHPIYTGVLCAVLGTAVAYREVRGLVALGLILWMFALKVRAEERLMVEHFGEQYTNYKRRVKALVPFLY